MSEERQIVDGVPLNVLEEAGCVIEDRQDSYGTRERNFTDIARMWSVILSVAVTPQHVALCMIALKICREMMSHKRDNLVDIAGYAQCLEELTEL